NRLVVPSVELHGDPRRVEAERRRVGPRPLRRLALADKTGIVAALSRLDLADRPGIVHDLDGLADPEPGGADVDAVRRRPLRLARAEQGNAARAAAQLHPRDLFRRELEHALSLEPHELALHWHSAAHHHRGEVEER